MAQTPREGVAQGCPWEPLVDQLHDGELSQDGAEQVRQHLADCVRCQRWLQVVLQLEVASRYMRHRGEVARVRGGREFAVQFVAGLLTLLTLAAVVAVLWFAVSP